MINTLDRGGSLGASATLHVLGMLPGRVVLLMAQCGRCGIGLLAHEPCNSDEIAAEVDGFCSNGEMFVLAARN
jgi:hypothetical protein